MNKLLTRSISINNNYKKYIIYIYILYIYIMPSAQIINISSDDITLPDTFATCFSYTTISGSITYSPNIVNMDSATQSNLISIITKLNNLINSTGEDGSLNNVSIYNEDNIVERLTFHTLAYKLYSKYYAIILHTNFFSNTQKVAIQQCVLFANYITTDLRNKLRNSAYQLNHSIIQTGLATLVLPTSTTDDSADQPDPADLINN